MPALLRSLLAAFLLLVFVPAAIADTSPSPGVAAYNKGDYKAALPLLEKEAAAGDAAAQTKLGLYYVKDLGVPHDPAKARAWFEKAAAQGHAEAEYCIGVMFDFGDGIAADAKTAVDWYRKAAEKGYAKAQYNLGSMYYEGLGVEKDRKAAADWYRKAAAQDDAQAQFWLGRLYISGDGIERNLLSARMWMARAAKLGFSDAAKGEKVINDGIAELVQAGEIPAVEGGDGSTMADAIYFPLAEDEHAGIEAEHRITRSFHPNWRWGKQSVTDSIDGEIYDVIELHKDGETRQIYFRITNWFGKLK